MEVHHFSKLLQHKEASIHSLHLLCQTECLQSAVLACVHVYECVRSSACQRPSWHWNQSFLIKATFVQACRARLSHRGEAARCFSKIKCINLKETMLEEKWTLLIHLCSSCLCRAVTHCQTSATHSHLDTTCVSASLFTDGCCWTFSLCLLYTSYCLDLFFFLNSSFAG